MNKKFVTPLPRLITDEEPLKRIFEGLDRDLPSTLCLLYLLWRKLDQLGSRDGILTAEQLTQLNHEFFFEANLPTERIKAMKQDSGDALPIPKLLKDCKLITPKDKLWYCKLWEEAHDEVS